MVEWKYYDSTITSPDGVEVINSNYSQELCEFTSTIIINNFTTANEGLYICNASQPTSNHSSDSVYVLRGK